MTGREPLRFAYADPPYLGRGWRNYYGQGFVAREFSRVERHVELVGELVKFDAWALSMSSNSLALLAPHFPAGTRIAAWVRPDGQPFHQVRVSYSWEPVAFFGGRRGRGHYRDYCSAPAEGVGFPGAKPRKFCFWLFDMIGIEPGDELVDMFPGTGGVADAFAAYVQQPALALS